MRNSAGLALAVALAAWPAVAAGPEVKVLPDAKAFAALLDGTAKEAAPVVVHFWATWCEACRAEMPKLPKIFAEAQKSGARVLLVSVDEPDDGPLPVQKFLDAAGVPGERFLLDARDPDPIVARIGGGWDGALPATFVFKGGKKTAAFVGPLKGARALADALKAR